MTLDFIKTLINRPTGEAAPPKVVINGQTWTAQAGDDRTLSLDEAARVYNQAEHVHAALTHLTGTAPLMLEVKALGRYAVAAFRPLRSSDGAYKAILRERRTLQAVLHTHDVDLSDHAGVVYVRWPLPGHRRLSLYVDALAGEPRDTDLGEPGGEWSLPVGLHTGTAQRVWVDLERQPHWLVTGGTGGGKSTLVRSALASLYQRKGAGLWRVAVVARTRAPWVGVDHMDNSWGVHLVRPGDGAVPMVDWLADEMDARLAGRRWSHRIVAVFDDTAGLLAAVPSLAERLARLAPDCRQAGIHLWLITQHPVADAVGGSLVMANLGARFVGPASSAQAAAQGGGRAGSAAATLLPGFMELTAGPLKEVVAVPYVAPDALPRTDGLPDEAPPWLATVRPRVAAPPAFLRPAAAPSEPSEALRVSGVGQRPPSPLPVAGGGDLLSGLLVSGQRERLWHLVLTAPPGTKWTDLIKEAWETKGGDSYMKATVEATAFVRELAQALASLTGYVAEDVAEDETEGEEADDDTD